MRYLCLVVAVAIIGSTTSMKYSGSESESYKTKDNTIACEKGVHRDCVSRILGTANSTVAAFAVPNSSLFPIHPRCRVVFYYGNRSFSFWNNDDTDMVRNAGCSATVIATSHY